MLTGLKCLALALYIEGRNQSLDVQTALGTVIMERANWQPALVCKVLKEPFQFTGFPMKVNLPIPKSKPDKVALVTTLKVARSVLNGKRSKKLKGHFKYFNHKRLGKRYHTSNQLVVAGDFVFY